MHKTILAALLVWPLVTSPLLAADQIKPSIDEVTDIRVKLHLFDSKQALKHELRQQGDINWRKSDAWTRCRVDLTNKISYCDVYQMRPRLVNDDATLDLGHEILHGVYGDYH